MNNPELHATTVVGVHHKGQTVLGADGQATLGATVAKENVIKVRKLAPHPILAGFAGGTADAFALLDRFEDKLSQFSGNLKRSAIELAKDWRTDRYLRRLEAMLIVMDNEAGLILSGNGDVLEPEAGIYTIGSGSTYALSAATALKRHAEHLTAYQIAEEALRIAADVCIYTNHNRTILTLEQE